MAALAGKYLHEKNENVVEFLIAQGLPENKAKLSDIHHPSLDISVEGNKYIVQGGLLDNSVIYVLDQEGEETLTKYNVTLKSTATLKGENLLITSKYNDGTSTKEYQTDDSGLVIVTTSTKCGNLVAKAFYKRV